MNVELLANQLVIGITIGSYLALIALGYTMVYGILELINFAHGDIFAFGFLFSLTVLQFLNLEYPLSVPQIIYILVPVMLLTMLAAGLLNVFIDRVAYRPLRNAPRLAPLITAVGASFALENLFAIWKGPSQIFYPPYVPRVDILREWLGIDTIIGFSTTDLMLLVVTIPLMILLSVFVRRTKLGKAMRATAQDREAAAMMGINVERVIMSTFFIGGALAGAAGMVFGLYLNTGRYLMGFEAGLMAFTAAVLGGIGNIAGAVLGGYFIGIFKALSDLYLPSEWTRAVVFAILVLVLVFRPAGLLGQATQEKV